ncbi:MAG: histidinol-phosphatase HisJ family protein [Candidatus Thorarchaeota archaeon]|jgi:histidinol-phosphatase (PHP family)
MMDYHIHPAYSADAEGTLDEFCGAALKGGLREICFTTHLDSDPVRDDSYVMVRGERVSVHDPGWFEDYENHVRTLGDEYASEGLNVLFGVEVDLYTGIIEDLPDAFHRTEFDLVIGSVHLIDHKAISLKEEAYAIFKKYGLEQIGNIYYDLIKDMLKTGLFDILGHLDIYRRYGEGFFGPEIHSIWKPHIDDLCRIMKAQGVGYEINTSSLRRGFPEPMPERAIVEAMHERGIETVTVGSDAHHPSEVGGGITDVLNLLRNRGIHEVTVFNNRKSKKIDIDSFK